jgi:L-fucono-1,5-lactonase
VTAAGAPAPGGPAAGAPVIDTHQHFWDLSAHDQPWLESAAELAPLRRNFTLADLAPLAAAEGVTASVVVQTVTESWETPELLALAAGPGLVAGVVGWADLAAPDVADVLAGLRELPGGDRLASIRHPVLVEPDQDWLARPAVLRGLAAVAAAGLAYDVVGEPRHLPAAVTAAAAVPELTFILDHLGNPVISPGASPASSEPWATAITRLAALPNTTAKLSGILGVPQPSGTTTGASTGTTAGNSPGTTASTGPGTTTTTGASHGTTANTSHGTTANTGPGTSHGTTANTGRGTTAGTGPGTTTGAGPGTTVGASPGTSPAALAHIRPYYDFVLHAFGPNRLMFGSDWPPCTLDASYAQVCAAARALTADLSRAEQDAIFNGTARQTYHLP